MHKLKTILTLSLQFILVISFVLQVSVGAENTVIDPNQNIVQGIERIVDEEEGAKRRDRSASQTAPEIIGNKLDKVLPLPYFNQCLESDKKTFFPADLATNDIQACRNMCSAAVMVMIAGYFGKLDYDPSNPDTLKKYMYTDNRQRITDDCGTNQGGAFGMIAKETDRLTGNTTSCNSGSRDGMLKYAANRGLYTKNLPVSQASIQSAIDRGNPVILSTLPHITLVKGYSESTAIKPYLLVMNDPYRNTEIDATEYSYNGNGTEYNLPDTYYNGTKQNFIYALEMSDRPLEIPKFTYGTTVISTADGDGINSGLSVREAACSNNRTARITKDSPGTILERRVVEYYNLRSDFKVWYKIQ